MCLKLCTIRVDCAPADCALLVGLLAADPELVDPVIWTWGGRLGQADDLGKSAGILTCEPGDPKEREVPIPESVTYSLTY